MDAVAAGAPADAQQVVADVRRLVDRALGDQPAGAAEDQRIADIARIEADRAVDGGDAHAVAVIAHAVDHAAHQPARMDGAGRQGRRIGVEFAEAEHVGVENRLGAQAGADDVADDAAEAGVGAAVGLDRGRAVVGLDLDAHALGVVVLDDAAVVLEHRQAPRRGDVIGRLGDGLFEQVVDDRHTVGRGVFDQALQGLVDAVLGPGLGERFEFDVGGVALQGAEMRLDRLHLVQGQAQAALARQLHQAGIVERGEGDLGARVAHVTAGQAQADGLARVDGDLLDRPVGEALPGQAVEVFVAGADHLDAGADAHADQDQAEILGALDDRGLDRIHDPGLALDLDHPAGGGGGRAEVGALDHRIDQQGGEALQTLAVEIGLDQVVAAATNVGEPPETQHLRLVDQMVVDGGNGGKDVDAMGG